MFGQFFKKCLGNNVKNTALYEYVYDFSVDYDSFDVDNISEFHKYILLKNNTK